MPANSSRFLRFVVCGGIAAVVNILARVALSQLVTYGVAVALAYLVGMTVAFALMKLFVFERSGEQTYLEYGRFAAVNAASLLQVWLVSIGLARVVFPVIHFHWYADTVAHVIGVMSPIPLSYIGHRSFSFARRR